MSIRIVKVKSVEKQAEYVINLLNKFNDYLLLLSGGKSPEELYFQMANNDSFKLPRDTAQVDDRWGTFPMHEFSNYRMIKDSGLLVRIEREGRRFHPMLIGENTVEKTSILYASKLSDLFVEYAGRIIGVFGVSEAGHIAGIVPDSPAIASEELVIGYKSGDKYGERVTLTLNTIRNHVDVAIVLLNTKEKLKSFEDIMKEGEIAKFPALVFKEMDDVEVICISQ